MTYAISDIHGCYEEYIKLLEKINFSEDDTLYILGDICDRGEKPMETYNDIITRDNVIPLFGNHEHLAYINLRHLIKDDASKLTKDERLDLIDWLTSGGKPTFSEFISLSKADRMDFMEFLKSFSMYEDITINGKRFVLTHAGLGGFSEDKPLVEYTLHELIWERADYSKRYFSDPGTFLVTGHTPTANIPNHGIPEAYKANGHIAIDCGCASGGRLCAYCFETDREFYVDKINQPLENHFKM